MGWSGKNCRFGLNLYEEKSHLLQENQLLYAVLQIDKKEEELRLSCRWLHDLTKTDEEMIEACDKAYDKAKHQVTRMGHAKQNYPKAASEPNPKTKKPTTPETSMKPFSIKLDADRTHLSHILQLKRLFLQHQGSTPIQIHFHSSVKSLATLHIESKWGVELSEQFKQKINELNCVLALE